MLRSALLAGIVLVAVLAFAGARDHQSPVKPATILPGLFEGFVLAGGAPAADWHAGRVAVINPRQSSRPPAVSGVFPDPFMQVISIKPGDFGELG